MAGCWQPVLECSDNGPWGDGWDESDRQLGLVTELPLAGWLQGSALLQGGNALFQGWVAHHQALDAFAAAAEDPHRLHGFG